MYILNIIMPSIKLVGCALRTVFINNLPSIIVSVGVARAERERVHLCGVLRGTENVGTRVTNPRLGVDFSVINVLDSMQSSGKGTCKT